jgi:peptidoglycan/xylan/chitin deacetylase (PgdA/CDA1 family)
MENTPIILYHDFCSETDKTKNNFAVDWNDFKQQMDYLHKNGFMAVSLAKFVAEQMYWKGEKAKEEGRGTKDEKTKIDTRKKVILTFDDGDISNYHFALPILKEKGFSGTFFITVNEIGKKNRMDWTMVYEMSRNGMEIGSHGLSHSFLTAYNNYTLLNELLMSKQILEKYIHKRVDFLSIPHGFYSSQVMEIAKDVGFKAACVSDAGYVDFDDEKLFVFKRFTMRRHYRIDAFKSIMSGTPQMTVLALEGIRTSLRKVLGYQVYDKLRSLRYREEKREAEAE